MKKNIKKVKIVRGKNKDSFDPQTLKHWKNVSVKGKLDFLDSALKFGKLKQF